MADPCATRASGFGLFESVLRFNSSVCCRRHRPCRRFCSAIGIGDKSRRDVLRPWAVGFVVCLPCLLKYSQPTAYFLIGVVYRCAKASSTVALTLFSKIIVRPNLFTAAVDFDLPHHGKSDLDLALTVTSKPSRSAFAMHLPR